MVDEGIGIRGMFLDEVILQSLGERAYQVYQHTLQHHYWRWKYHRVSDHDELQLLRLIIYRSGALTLLRAPEWRIDRTAAEYAQALGDPVKHSNQTQQANIFSGLRAPSDLLGQADSGAGNCTALYEMARPWWTGTGWGRQLLFSIQGTLKNCLRDELQSDDPEHLIARRCEFFYQALRTIEISSVAEFVLRRVYHITQDLDEAFDEPFNLLLPQKVNLVQPLDLNILKEAETKASELLKMHRERFQPEGEQLLVATMLGFLIDELVARAQVPNGMEFWYRSVAAELDRLIDNFNKVAKRLKDVGFDAKQVAHALPGLLADARYFADVSNPRQGFDQAWLRNTEATAEQLRTAGLRARKRGHLGDDYANMVFVTSNELRRWVFFIEQRQIFAQGNLPCKLPNQMPDMLDLVMRWLRRPWGVVRPENIQIAFSGFVAGDEPEEMPRAFSALTQFMTSEFEDYLISGFKFKDSAAGMDALRAFVSRRIILHLLRTNVTRIRDTSTKSVAERQKAQMLINLFELWVYEADHPERVESLEADITILPDLWREGQWLKDYLAQHPGDLLLTRRQEQVALEYLHTPDEFSAELFRFNEEGFNIESFVDVYPPERFFYGGVAEI
jgi:hypothetical protein